MQSYQRFQCIGHTVFNTSGTNGPRSLLRMKAGTHSAFGEGSHTRAHTAKQGPSLPRPQRGHVPPARLPPKEQPEKADARLMACVRFLRRRSPAGLRCLVCNLAVLLFFALRSVLSACARQGGYHHSWRALHVVETPDARLSKRLICYFLGLTDSSLIPAAQNIIPFSLQIPEEPAGDPLVLSLLFASPYLP